MGEVLDVAIKVYLRNAVTLFKIVLVVIVPVHVVGTLIILSAVPDASEVDAATGAVDSDVLWTFLAGLLVVFLLEWMATTVATAACYKTVAGSYLGDAPGWTESLSFARRRIRALLWLTFLQAVLTALGFLACFFPGVYLVVAYTVAMPALLTEDVRGRAALGRALRLVRNRWWATFAVILLGFLLGLVVEVVVGTVAEIATPAGDDFVTLFVLNAVVAIVTGVIVTPFQAAVATVLYFDLRVRKEAFDLELLTQRIGIGTGGQGEPPSPPAAPPGWSQPEPPRSP